MVRLTISPLRGLINFWFTLSYNLFIPSGFQNRIGVLLSKICKESDKCSIEMLNRNQENMPATYHFGLKTLFDGYLTTSEFLCDGYVIGGANNQFNSLIINEFLCDGYVIGSPILFDGHLIKEKL
jgi:hypothetical protein